MGGPQPTINPYAPPGADVTAPPIDGAPGGAMWSPMQIGVAAFFGSVLGGATVMQANYRAMGEPRAANVTIGIAVAVTIAMYVAVFNVPQSMAVVIGLVAIISFCILASRLQGDLYTDHLLAGGRRGSSWWVLGAILASVAVRATATLAVRLMIRRLQGPI